MNVQHTGDDEHLDTQVDDPNDTDLDDGGTTPEDTPEGDDPINPDAAEKAAQAQEDKWLDDIKSGKKSPEDMPENLGWLKERVEKKLEAKPKSKPKTKVDLREQVRNELREERAAEEFQFLIEDLKEADLSAEQGAQLKEEYEDYLGNFDNPTSAQRVKALTLARRLVGLKSNSEVIKERRRRGAALPPSGGRRRDTISNKEKLTEAEKALSGDLPPGFAPPKK